MKIEVESEALDSLKTMVEQLQSERDELLEVLKSAHHEFKEHFAEQVSINVFMSIHSAISKCTAKPKVIT